MSFCRVSRVAEVGDVLGDIMRTGEPTSLGSALALLDMAAGRCASLFTEGPVVTGCFDDVAVTGHFCHGDVVTARAEVVAVGTASVLLYVVIKKAGAREREGADMMKALVTFVGVEEGGGVRKVSQQEEDWAGVDSPGFTIGGQTVRGREVMEYFKVARGLFREDDTRKLAAAAQRELTCGNCEAYCNSEGYVDGDTVLRIRKQFLPRHLNFAGVVFGGDVLECLEAVAVTCAQRAKGNKVRYRVAGVRALAFMKAVEVRKVLEVEAEVVCESAKFSAVMVRTWLDDRHDASEMVPAHAGVFHLAKEVHEGATSINARAGVRRERTADFYRTMALPIATTAKEYWDSTGKDRYPSTSFVMYSRNV